MAFSYAAVPSLGKHQLETFSFSFNSTPNLGFANMAVGIDYQNTDYLYFDVSGITRLESFEKLHLLSTHIGISKPLKNEWKLQAYATPVISSNLSNGLTQEDIILGYGFQIVKRWKRNDSFTELGIGFEYGTTVLGSPSLFPVVTYQKKLSEHLSFLLGYPQSGVTYTASSRHTIRLSGSLQGFYYNNSDAVVFNNSAPITNTKLVFSGLDFGLAHLYRIQPRITTTVKIGYLTSNNLEIETADGTSLYDFSPNDSIYFSMGIMYNLKMDFDE